jgi:hypothetical protein
VCGCRHARRAGDTAGTAAGSDLGGALETEEGAESVERDALLGGLLAEWRERERVRREGKAAKKRAPGGRGKGGKAGSSEEAAAGGAAARDIRSMFSVVKSE